MPRVSIHHAGFIYFTAYLHITRSILYSTEGDSISSLQLSHVTAEYTSTLNKNGPCRPATPISSNQGSFLVIGAGSFLGSHISINLHQRSGLSILALEDILFLDNSSLLWYRWAKVLAEGIPSSHVDFSNSSEVCDLLKRTSPNVIVYVPAVLFDGHQVSNIDDVVRLEKIIAAYNNFLVLLNAVRGDILPRVILLTLSTTTASIQSGWLRAFEQTLLAYHNSHQLSVGVVSMDGVYGPWEEPIRSPCRHVNDISDIVMKIAHSNCSSEYQNMSCRNVAEHATKMEEWQKEYNAHRQEQNKMVVVSTYFTQQRNRQYKITFNQDNFRFLEDWFLGLYKLSLPMIIVHDSLSEAFTTQIKKMHPLIEFVKVTDFHGRASNDERFFLYYDYLLGHPEVSHIIMTDLRDVKILANPFEVFSVLGDKAYVGLDRPFFVTSVGSSNDHFYPRCLPGVDFEWERHLLGSYNAGVLGGSRPLMLSVLTHLTRLLDLNIAENCNMPALFYVLHRYYFKEVFYGWPYQVGFDTQQVQVVGNCIVHKYPPVLPTRKSKRRKKS